MIELVATRTEPRMILFPPHAYDYIEMALHGGTNPQKDLTEIINLVTKSGKIYIAVKKFN